jgi:putative nucleotidyltransferase with HDIG domain
MMPPRNSTPVQAALNQLDGLKRQLEIEKRRNLQYQLLAELSQQLEAQLDQPVAAQLAVNTLERAIECSLIILYLHETEDREFVALATAGSKTGLIPPGYRQDANQGMLGRVARLRKTQIANDTRLDRDFFSFDEERSLSSLVVPLIHNGHLKGMIEVNAVESEAFHSYDVALVEAVGAELTRAWERSSYHQHLTDLIQAGISLSTLIEPRTAVDQIAAIARQTLSARFIHITLLDQAGNFTQRASIGHAPKLKRYLESNSSNNALVQAALGAPQAFRIRDLRRYPPTAQLEIDQVWLRSVLAIPIRLHRLSIGAVLAFGKKDEVFFTENDESLGTLLSSQAAAAVESTWLYDELRSSLTTTTSLYQVSFQILQSEDLGQALDTILKTAYKIASARSAGVVLFTPDHQVEVEMEIDSTGLHPGAGHPMDLISQAMDSGSTIFASDQSIASVCFPIHSHSRRYGGMWLKIPENLNYDSRHTAALQTLANQLERAILLISSRGQAREIEAAYQELEATYDRTLAALISALDARDRETEGHSVRVSRLAGQLGRQLGLPAPALKALERGALLHDIGKIGISDLILNKPGPLTPEEWRTMHLHPDIGARIVEDIPFLQDSLPVIRGHHERWDGSGYPLGLQGTEIPRLARIFSVADAFDAMISDRPYRERVPAEEALAYLVDKAGLLFESEIVFALRDMITRDQTADLLVPE